MKEHIEQAIKNYAREVAGRIATKVDCLFEKRDQFGKDVAIEMARFLVNEAADSVQPLLFIRHDLLTIEDAKLFIERAGRARDAEMEKGVRHFETGMATITDIENFKVGGGGEIYLYANDTWFKLEK
jgi:hypothetical protein